MQKIRFFGTTVIFASICALFVIGGFEGLLGDHSSSKLPIIASERMPPFEIETLGGTKQTLAICKPSLFLIGFDENASREARSWLRAIRKEIPLPNSIQVSLIPVFGNSITTKLMRPFLFQAVRKAVPPSEHSNVYLSFTDPRPLQAFLSVTKKTVSSVFVVLTDSTGKIRWTHVGPATEESKQELARKSREVTEKNEKIAAQ
jgi:hypothetical protein